MFCVRGASSRALAASLTSLALLTACATTARAPADRAYTGRFAGHYCICREARKRFRTLRPRDPRCAADSGAFVTAGTTVARIEVEPGGARATGAQMQEVRGTDADALTEKLLGWPLPVSGLADWIEGRPVPSRSARVEREDGPSCCWSRTAGRFALPSISTSLERPIVRVADTRASGGCE